MFEVEQKFRLGNLSAFRSSVKHLGGDFTSQMVETDTYFSHPCRDFASTDEALRIRLRENEDGTRDCFTTYKGPKLHPILKTRLELDMPLPSTSDTQQWIHFWNALGFNVIYTVKKTRHKTWVTWQDERVEISLDEVPPTGFWTELEIVVPEKKNIPSTEKKIQCLAAFLGLVQAERRSYLELVMEAERSISE